MIPSVTKNERKTKGLSTKIWLGLGLAILPIGLAMGLILGQTGSTLAPAPDTPSQSIQPTTLAQIASEPTTPPEPPAEPPIFRTELDRFETPLTDFDPQAESIATVVQNSLDVNIRLASTQDPAEELPAPEQKPLEPENTLEAKADSEESTLVITQATQKREFRVGRGFSAKKAKGIFTLELDKELDEKLHVTGPRTQELVGESSGSWKISMDDLETELILTLQSKPGPKWQVSTLVQIPSAPSGPPGKPWAQRTNLRPGTTRSVQPMAPTKCRPMETDCLRFHKTRPTQSHSVGSHVFCQAERNPTGYPTLASDRAIGRLGL
jgi:hypothetical protein